MIGLDSFIQLMTAIFSLLLHTLVSTVTFLVLFHDSGFKGEPFPSSRFPVSTASF
jgi:hypothetical protein